MLPDGRVGEFQAEREDVLRTWKEVVQAAHESGRCYIRCMIGIACATGSLLMGFGWGAPQDKAPSQVASERFVVLSEFQVWADAAGPEVSRELSRLYNAKGRSHIFDLYPRYELFVWDRELTRKWVDEAKSLECFNLFCLGDDVRTAKGHLFDDKGVNPQLREFLFDAVAYAHEQGLLVAIEPTHLPNLRTRESLRPWLATWLGPKAPASSRPDVVKVSLEWFGGWLTNPEIAAEVEAFFEAVHDVSPGTMVYLDSIGGFWREPQVFHRWLIARFPGTILSHYLNTEQIPAFRAIGARNLMVQINPSETFEEAGQFFIYHDITVRQLRDVAAQRLRFVSLAGVNYGFNRTNYEQFLEVLRPHLNLARTLEEVREALDMTPPPTKPSVEEVAAALVERARKSAEEQIRREPAAPLNKAGRPAWFGETPDGWIRGLSGLADGLSGAKFEGAYTEPIRRRPARATFGVDMGAPTELRSVRVVPCLAEIGPEYVARELRLEYLADGKWQTLPGAQWRDNQARSLTFRLRAPVTAEAVRVVILSQSDDGKGNYRACCQELAVNPE